MKSPKLTAGEIEKESRDKNATHQHPFHLVTLKIGGVNSIPFLVIAYFIVDFA